MQFAILGSRAVIGHFWLLFVFAMVVVGAALTGLRMALGPRPARSQVRATGTTWRSRRRS